MGFTDEDLRLAVKNGAYWMDDNHPGWAKSIDLEILEMGDCYTCIIGQAIGDYSQVVDRPFGRNWAIENGFEAPVYGGTDREYDGFVEDVVTQYRGLEIIWTEEVQKRLG